MLRLFINLTLILSLLVGGIGPVRAAMVMPPQASEEPAQLADAALPCEHAAPGMQAAATPAPSPAHPADCDEGCCEQGACHCPCMQGAQAMLHGLAIAAAVPRGTRLVPAFGHGHGVPALSHPIRPPIGQ